MLSLCSRLDWLCKGTGSGRTQQQASALLIFLGNWALVVCSIICLRHVPSHSLSDLSYCSCRLQEVCICSDGCQALLSQQQCQSHFLCEQKGTYPHPCRAGNMGEARTERPNSKSFSTFCPQLLQPVAACTIGLMHLDQGLLDRSLISSGFTLNRPFQGQKAHLQCY